MQKRPFGPLGFDIDAKYPRHTIVIVDQANSVGQACPLLTAAAANSNAGLLVGTLCETSNGFGNPTEAESDTQSKYHSVDPLTRGKEFTAIANGAIAVGADIFLAADGEVSNAGTVRIGIATTATTADGQYVNGLCTL